MIWYIFMILFLLLFSLIFDAVIVKQIQDLQATLGHLEKQGKLVGD